MEQEKNTILDRETHLLNYIRKIVRQKLFFINEVDDICQNLSWLKMKNETFSEALKKFEPYTVEQLEEVILDNRKSVKKVDDKLECYMEVRQWKINETFEWTPENREKLLHLNQKLMNCFEKLRNEAIPIVAVLEKRLDDKDAFLHDYEIEGTVKPFILTADNEEPCDGIDNILHEIWDDWALKIDLRTQKWFNDNLYLTKDLNWNIDRHLKGQFDEHYISYAIHILHDHTCWSLPDILKINHLWSELKIWHQNFEDIKTV